jgi:hypothetical protein
VGCARAPLAAIEGLGHDQPPQVSTQAPDFVESGFSELLLYGVLRGSSRLTVRGELGGLPETPAEVLYPLLDPCRAYLRLLETPSSPWGPSLRSLRK